MKVNVVQVLKTYEGKEVTEPERDKENKIVDKPITLRILLVSALQRNDPSKVATAEEQAKIHQLCLKIYNSNEPEFTHGEIAFMEEKVSKLGNSLYYGRVLDAFGDIAPANPTEAPKN